MALTCVRSSVQPTFKKITVTYKQVTGLPSATQDYYMTTSRIALESSYGRPSIASDNVALGWESYSRLPWTCKKPICYELRRLQKKFMVFNVLRMKKPPFN